jgi:hypothetical protein
MKRQDPWERLAEAARSEPDSPSSTPAGWSEQVARRAMDTAALGRPGFATVVLAWAGTWKVLLPLALLLVAGGGAVLHRATESRRPEVRYEKWSEDTLRQVRAWLPLECEEAGTIGLLMKARLEELKAQGKGRTDVGLLLRSTEAEISRLLTPDQRLQFEGRQRELRNRWFPSDEKP